MAQLTLWTFVYLLLRTAVRANYMSELYFSNQQNIMKFLGNGSSTIVISDPTLVDAIDCNVCDRMIYWMDQPGIIKRANPVDRSTVQVVIDDDLSSPRGLAVDWKGNNIYFSHGSGSHGRIEVTTHDGAHRKILMHDINNVMAVSVNVVTGHLYYVHDTYKISRMQLNGNNSELIYQDGDASLGIGIIGLEVDSSHNRLFWTKSMNSDIRFLDLNTLERSAQRIATSDKHPYQLTVSNNTLFWTEPNVGGGFTQDSNRPGALYAMDVVTRVPMLLLREDTLAPHDVCYFYNNTLPLTGCALNNGGCDTFCFTVPDGAGGTQEECGCSTGILLSQEGICPKYPHNFLLFTQEHSSQTSLGEVDRTDIRMISLDIPGKFVDILTPITVPGTSAKFLAYDITRHEVYWSQLDPPQIVRAALDGSHMEILIQTSISLPESLGVDPYSSNLYWVDSNLDKIEVYAIESGYRMVLINTGMKPQGLALDLRNRYVYWTDLELSRPRVERCHLDGSGREIVLPNLSPSQIRQPATITVDPITGWVYWAEVEYNKLFLFTGDPDMDQYPELTVSGIGDVSSLAINGDYLYWTDRSGIQPSISRMNKMNKNDRMTISNVDGVHGLLAANQSTETVPTGCVMCDQLCLPSNVPSQPTCACSNNLIGDSQGGCIDPSPVMIVATDNSLSQFNRSDSFWDTDVSFTRPHTTVSAIDMDYIDRMLYWIDRLDNLIYRSHVYGTSREKVIGCCTGAPTDLAVDWFGRNLYWIDSTRRVIEVSKLDGSRRITLYNIPVDLGVPELITLDPLRGHLYWTPQSSAKIYRMNMDGNASSVSEFWKALEHKAVFGLAMNYSENAGVMDQLYWGVNTMNNDDFRVVMFAKSVDNAISATESFSALDPSNWEEAKNLKVVNGDYYIQTRGRNQPGPFIGVIEHDDPGHNFNIEVDSYPFSSSSPNLTFFDFIIVHHSIQPGQHECSVLNKGCGGGSLCLVKSGVRGECVCPPLQALGVETDPNGISYVTCTPTDSFLLIATESSIYNLPVPDPKRSSSTTTSRVQALPLGIVGRIGTLAYDPVKKSVLYTDSNTLHSVALDSSFETSFPLVENLEPQSLAYDWFDGHIFTTERAGFQIDLMTINGEGVGSVLNIDSEEKYQLNILGDVVFDNDTRTLYWTYKSIRDNLGRELHSMNLNTMVDVKIDIGKRRIDKLTVDSSSHVLYWIESSTDPGTVSIEKYNSTNGMIETVVERASSVSALAAVQVGSQAYLFWFNDEEKMIYSFDGTAAREYQHWDPGNVSVVAMVGHKTSETIYISSCLSNPRPCSHYCLTQTSGSYQCDCPAYRKLLPNNLTTCSSSTCSSLLKPCGSVFGECYPRTYWCDNIPHCRNGADEMCGCPSDSFGCYLSSNDCVPMSAKCNGVDDCLKGEDELDCCEPDMFGCYVDDDTPDSLGGGFDIRYRCWAPSFMCDDTNDCHNSTIDEPASCPEMTTATAPVTSTPSSAVNLPVIITAVALVAVVLMSCGILGSCMIRHIAKKRHEYSTNNVMSRALNSVLSDRNKSGDSPRVDSQSDYYSDFSNGTTMTQLGNGSSVSASQVSPYKRRSVGGFSTDPSNPPPSPMTMRHSRFSTALTDIEDDQSMFSEHMSEFPVPPPPNPSLNYDADMISDNLSYSVSQNRYPATISGKSYNPFRVQQYRQHNGPHYNYSGYPPTPQRGQWSSNGGMTPQHIEDKREGMQQSNGKYPYSNPYHHYFPSSHMHKELDSLARTETESTISVTTVSTENRDDYHYEDMMLYPPPGRPPSPVTVVSDYPPPAPPMSPDSTLSEISDECSEKHLHQT